MDNWDLFQSNRRIPAKDKIISCYAPFNHIYITRKGQLSSCCWSTSNQQWLNGKFSLKDYWFGERSKQNRQQFFGKQFHKGCENICGNYIKKNIPPPIYDYDFNVEDERLEHALSDNHYPKVIDFNLSNLCNFACPMCNGELSSKHMLGRDKFLKQYAPNMFDDEQKANQLLNEFKEFIPHLTKIRFTGGEPFAHKFLFKFCDVIAELKPDLPIHITTNGSVFSKKVEKIFTQNNIKLSISLDTVIEEEYTKIRIGGNYKDTFSNVKKFKKHIGSKNININSVFMSVNALNIDKFFKYAYKNNFKVFINTYDRSGREHTDDWGIDTLSKKQKKQVYENLLLTKWSFPKNYNPKEIDKCLKQIREGYSFY